MNLNSAKILFEYRNTQPLADTLLELSFSTKNNYKSYNNCKFLSKFSLLY